MWEHSLRGSSLKRNRGVSYGAPVFCRQIPFDGIAAEIRRGVAGEVCGIPGGVLTAVMGRVLSETDSRTGAEAASRTIPGERL